MTTAVDVLAYISGKYSTFGVMQRQKLLYYSQAWALTWFGRPLFDDAVTAFRMGPVCVPAWKVDREPAGVAGVDGIAPLHETQVAVVDAVFEFYGELTGGQLSELTHQEDPWLDNYEHASPQGRGFQEITHVDMQRFYTKQCIVGAPAPTKPAITLNPWDPNWDLKREVEHEIARFGSMLAILADR